MRRAIEFAFLVIATEMLAGLGFAQQVPAFSPPAGQVYLGIWADPDLDPQGHGSQERAIEVREGPAPLGVNRTFALHLHYYQWPDLAQALGAPGSGFQPDNDLSGDIQHGRVPVISWKCDGFTPNSDAAIANGDPTEDALILTTARLLAQYPGPVILRWFWEFNVLHKNLTCRGDDGKTPTQPVYDNFIGAWRRIRVLFHQAGADNVIFLWNPGVYKADGVEDDPHRFYPGNGFVDWIGVDTYQQTSEAFADDFDLFYNDFTDSRYGKKPLMVGENGALPLCGTPLIPNCVNVEQQYPYLLGLLADVQANRYPLLKAYCYFENGRQAVNWVLDGAPAISAGGITALQMLGATPSFSPIPGSRPSSQRASEVGSSQ